MITWINRQFTHRRVQRYEANSSAMRFSIVDIHRDIIGIVYIKKQNDQTRRKKSCFKNHQ